VFRPAAPRVLARAPAARKRVIGFETAPPAVMLEHAIHMIKLAFVCDIRQGIEGGMRRNGWQTAAKGAVVANTTSTSPAWCHARRRETLGRPRSLGSLKGEVAARRKDPRHRQFRDKDGISRCGSDEPNGDLGSPRDGPLTGLPLSRRRTSVPAIFPRKVSDGEPSLR